MFKKLGCLATILLGATFLISNPVSADNGIEKISVPESQISSKQFEEWDKKAEELTKSISLSNEIKSVTSRAVLPGDYVSDSAIEDGVYKIKLRDSALYLDVKYSTSVNGQIFNAWTQHNGFAQMFYIKNVGNGEVIIFDMLNWRAMEIQNSNNFNGSQIQLWDLHAFPTQRWKIETVTVENDYPEQPERRSFRFINVNSSKALDLIGSRQATGNTFWAWSKADVSSQKFRLQFLSN